MTNRQQGFQPTKRSPPIPGMGGIFADETQDFSREGLSVAMVMEASSVGLFFECKTRLLVETVL